MDNWVLSMVQWKEMVVPEFLEEVLVGSLRMDGQKRGGGATKSKMPLQRRRCVFEWRSRRRKRCMCMKQEAMVKCDCSWFISY